MVQYSHSKDYIIVAMILLIGLALVLFYWMNEEAFRNPPIHKPWLEFTT